MARKLYLATKQSHKIKLLHKETDKDSVRGIALLCSNKSTKFHGIIWKKSFSRSEDIAQSWDATQGLDSTLRV